MQKIIPCWLLVLFLAGLPIAPFCARAAEAKPERKPLAEFTTPKDARVVLLPVKFDEKEYLFELDTGCSRTVFDISFKDQLGKSKRTDKANVLGKRIDVEVFDAPEAFLGPFNLKDCGEISASNLKPIALALKKDIRGLIGMDLLRNYAVQIDFDKGKVLFLRSRPEGGIFSFLQPKKNRHPEWGRRLPIRYVKGKRGQVPCVRGTIEGIEVDFEIDTGYAGFFANSAGLLRGDILKKIRSKTEWEATVTSAESRAASDQNAFDVTHGEKYALVGKFSLGSLEYRHVIFWSGEKSRLGLRLLSRHLVTFDFPNNNIYLRKGATFDRTNDMAPEVKVLNIKGLDFALRRNEHGPYVHSIDPNGPAYKEGIRQNDMILKVCDRDVTSHTMAELALLFSDPGSDRLSIIIQRANDIKEVTFTLAAEDANDNGTD